MTGVWEGETEPSVSIRAHDGEEGMRSFSAHLGERYDQDAVLIFGDKEAGDVLATFATAGREQADIFDALKSAGIQGARITANGNLQVIGSGERFVKQLDRLDKNLGGGGYDAQHGSFSLLDRESGDYTRALENYERYGNPVTIDVDSFIVHASIVLGIP